MKKSLKFLAKTCLLLFVLLNVMVMFHAYKLTHFYEKNDTAITNQNSITSWGKSKQIFFGTNAVKQQNIAPDTAVQTVKLITADNLMLEGWYLPAENARGSVALFHGHGGKKSSMLPEAAVFRRLGYNTFLLDFRAHGSSEGHTSTIGYKESEDVKLAYNYLAKRGEKNIVLYGISLGAATITKAIDDYTLEPSKLILEMPFASLPDAVNGRLKMMHMTPQPLGTLLTFWGGIEHGFWAFNLEPAEYAKKINCPVLMQWGRNDPRVSVTETTTIFNNIKSDKKLVIYEESGHESLYKKEPGKWSAEVATFLR